MVTRCGNIENDKLVGAFDVVARRELSGIAGVAQIDEVHALDHALAVGVQARNDAVRETHPLPPAYCTKLERIFAPTGPDFSGWNCVAKIFPCSSTATN